MFQPRVRPGVDEKILSRVVADQIQPEVWITTRKNQRHPDPAAAQPVEGATRPGDHRETPEYQRQIVESLFPKGRAAGSPTVMSETNGLRRALGATAGIDIGNPLIQDERVSIKYP